MNKFLPNQAENYLIKSLNERISCDLKKELSESLQKYSQIVLQEKNGGGAGKGFAGLDKKGKGTSDKGVLFGDEDSSKLGSAAGLYLLGKGAKTLADVVDTTGAQRFGDLATSMIPSLPKVSGFGGDIVKGLGSAVIKGIPGMGAALLRQLHDISGAGWFDANIEKIGRSQLELSAQGAGSPWTPFVIPGKTKAEVK